MEETKNKNISVVKYSYSNIKYPKPIFFKILFTRYINCKTNSRHLLWNGTQPKYTDSFSPSFLIYDFILKNPNKEQILEHILRSLHFITVLTNYFHEKSYLTKCSSIIQAHRNFFGTSLLVSDRGGVKVKRLPKGLHGGLVPCSRHNSWWQTK